MLRRLFEFILGTDWRDLPPVNDAPLPNLLAPCLRPKDDPRHKRHWYGRKEERSETCRYCGRQEARRKVAAPVSEYDND